MIVSDMAIMVRSMAGDVAAKAADRLQPTEEQMTQIDAPAEENIWHEPPDVSRQKIQDQIKGIKGRTPFGKKSVKDGSTDATAVAAPQGTMDPADATAVAVQQKPVGILTDAVPATGTQVTDPPLKDKDAKKKLKEYGSRGQNYLNRKMPKERREQTIWRLKKMVGDLYACWTPTNMLKVVEIQGHPDCIPPPCLTS
jgi:hypothetical protein